MNTKKETKPQTKVKGVLNPKERCWFFICLLGAWLCAVLAVASVVINMNNTEATISLAANATQHGNAELMGQIASVVSGNGEYIHVSTSILYAVILLSGLIAYALSMKAVAIYKHVTLRSLYHKGYWRYFYRHH